MITKEFIKSIDIFKELFSEEFDKVIALAKEEIHKKGEFIVKEGEQSSKFYAVESGVIEIGRTSRANTKFTKLARLERGEIFGELSIFENSVNSASALVVLVPEAKIVSWEVEKVRKLLSAEPLLANKVMHNLLKKLSVRLRLASEAIYTLTNIIEKP